MHGQRNNLLAGLLVLVAIAATVAAIILLGGGLEYLGKHKYQILFDLDEGVGGLKSGAEVHVGGKPVGVVSDVQFDLDNNNIIDGVLVEISIDNTVPLKKGARPLLLLPLLGTQGVINFPEIGSGQPLTANDIIQGDIAPPGFLANAGYGEEQKAQLQNTIARASSIADNLDVVMSDARTVSDDVRQKWPNWSDKVSDTLDRAPDIAADMQESFAKLKEVGQTVQDVIAENRTDVREATERFASVGEKTDAFMDDLRGELSEAALEMLENGRDAFETADTTVADLRQFINEERPNIRRTLANFRLGSDQLRDTLVEVRRAPWRLIYRPDLRELNYELLYDAARSYAGAVSDLRSTTESLQALVDANATQPLVRQESLEELLSNMQSAYTNYQSAEAAFMEQLLKGAQEQQTD